MCKFEFATPPKIKRVYHYQKFDSGWIESLVDERRIRFSSPMAFNDPWDCRPCYNKSIADNPVELEKHVDAFVEAHRRYRTEISDQDRQALRRQWLSNQDLVKSAIDESAAETATVIDQRYRVYCVGTKPDCQLMWAHYGEKHSGVCLEFSTENEVFSGAIKVEYLGNSSPTTFWPGAGRTSCHSSPSRVLGLMKASIVSSQKKIHWLLRREH
jgi:hypothetical protein